MPELPEVETIRRQLAPIVQGRRLARVEILDHRWSMPLAPSELADALEGRRVVELQRRGKYLLWRLDAEVSLAQHLRMSGVVLADPDPEPPHVRVRIELSARRGRRGGATGEAGRAGTRSAAGEAGRAGTRSAAGEAGRAGTRSAATRLAVVDPRRFGTAHLLLGEPALEEFFAKRLGPEPFDEGFTAEGLHRASRGRSAPVKAFLLDQRRVAGVGNIYADEALFRAEIHPRRPAGRLTPPECERLRDAVIESLQAGIDAKGASIDDFRHIDGVTGSFQDRFLIHLRAGQPCVRCGREIVKTVVAGRGTYVCEHCQRPPRGLAGSRGGGMRRR